MLVGHVYSALSEEMPAGAGRAVTFLLLLVQMLSQRYIEIFEPWVEKTLMELNHSWKQETGSKKLRICLISSKWKINRRYSWPCGCSKTKLPIGGKLLTLKVQLKL